MFLYPLAILKWFFKGTICSGWLETRVTWKVCWNCWSHQVYWLSKGWRKKITRFCLMLLVLWISFFFFWIFTCIFFSLFNWRVNYFQDKGQNLPRLPQKPPPLTLLHRSLLHIGHHMLRILLPFRQRYTWSMSCFSIIYCFVSWHQGSGSSYSCIWHSCLGQILLCIWYQIW